MAWIQRTSINFIRLYCHASSPHIIPFGIFLLARLKFIHIIHKMLFNLQPCLIKLPICSAKQCEQCVCECVCVCLPVKQCCTALRCQFAPCCANLCAFLFCFVCFCFCALHLKVLHALRRQRKKQMKFLTSVHYFSTFLYQFSAYENKFLFVSLRCIYSTSISGLLIFLINQKWSFVYCWINIANKKL